MKRLPRVIMCLLFAALAGCSPGYVVRAAYQHSQILLGRKKITAVIADPATTAADREKLATVLAARDFAVTMGLDPKKSFTRYSRVDRDVLAWVVAGARPDAFELYTWWFPIVGTVPYKGFFERADAKGEAQRLEKKGYETWVRGTEAFSTLGWFNDPVLSTTLKHDHNEIANTVIHESVHSTIWIPNHVDFNESLANFVGLRGALDFARSLVPANDARVAAAAGSLTREIEIGAAVERLYASLDALYTAPGSREEKIAARSAIFERETAPIRAHYPTLRILQSINNAEIIQLKLYLTALGDFQALHERGRGDWKLFFDSIRAIQARIEQDSAADPFAILKEFSANPEEASVP